MSHIDLTAAGLGDISKAVISLWFRVPKKSIARAKAAINTDPYYGIFIPIADAAPFVPSYPPPPKRFNGIIPLMTFGKTYADCYTLDVSTTNFNYTTNEWLVAGSGSFCSASVVDSHSEGESGFFGSPGTDFSSEPSYIGVDCTGDDPVLRIFLQTNQYPTLTKTVWRMTGASLPTRDTLSATSYVYTDLSGTSLCSGISLGDDGSGNFVVPYWDSSSGRGPWTTSETWVDRSQPELGNIQREYFGGTVYGFTVIPDTWHHVLLSFDLGGTTNVTGNFDGSGSGITTAKRLWLAFDNVNYARGDMQLFMDGGNLSLAPGGSNDLISSRAWSAYFTGSSPPIASGFYLGPAYKRVDTVSGWDGNPTYDIGSCLIEQGDPEVSLPASAAFSSSICEVALAEFQMFTGVTLDTSVESNRRAFVTAGGLPVNAYVPSPGKVPSLQAAKLLGKPPEVVLHGSNRWMLGQNSGSAGSFDTKGRIIRYEPDPVLKR